jgi:hypothetical protein
MTQTPSLRAFVPSKLLGDLVDLVGIEPTTSSMPWKRAPSCATGPHSYRRRLPSFNSRLASPLRQTRPECCTRSSSQLRTEARPKPHPKASQIYSTIIVSTIMQPTILHSTIIALLN